MNIEEYIFDEYIICPICGEKKQILTHHLKHKHGYINQREFKLENGIPFGFPLVCRNLLAKMRENGKRRSEWFKENVSPKGVEITRKKDIVPKESRKHVSRMRKGITWIKPFVDEMRKEGWIDLHDASELIGFSYNYMRKCATDKRLQTVMMKGIRFTTKEWVEDTRKLLQENREKYRPDLLK